MAHDLPYPLPDRDTCTLDEWKQYKMSFVDIRTGELIKEGFVYSGKTLSASVVSQINLTNTEMKRDDPSLTYPIVFNTKDNLDTISIADAVAMNNLYLTALSSVRGHYDSGTTIKDQIRAAADKDAVDAVTDNR